MPANKLMKGFIGAGEHRHQFAAVHVVGGDRLQTGLWRRCGALLAMRMWKTAIWWCWSARTPPGRTRCCSSGLAQAKRDNPRLRIVVIDPRRTATCEIADRHLALARGATVGCSWGCLTPWRRPEPASTAFAMAHRRWPRRGWDVATVADFCGLTVDEVAAFYREFIAAPRAITLYTMGINQSASGSDNVTPSSTSIWPAGSMAAPAAAPFR